MIEKKTAKKSASAKAGKVKAAKAGKKTTTAKKMAVKPAKKTAAKSTGSVKSVVKPAPSRRAAEVEANLGGSVPLGAFLRRAGWY